MYWGCNAPGALTVVVTVYVNAPLLVTTAPIIPIHRFFGPLSMQNDPKSLDRWLLMFPLTNLAVLFS